MGPMRRLYLMIVKLLSVPPVLGGSGAPTGMLVITGIGWKTALLKLASNVPTAIGPSTCVTSCIVTVGAPATW